MKKIKYFVSAAVIALFMLGNPAYAIANFSASDSNFYVEDTFKVSLFIDAAAAWNVHISSDGPVDDCTLVDVDTTPDALDAEEEFTVECQVIETGEITVSLSGDYTTADGTTIDLSDDFVIIADARSEEEPEPGEEPGEEESADESPTEDITGNIPDTGANHSKAGADANELTYLIAFPIVAVLVILSLVIRRMIHRA